ncbi:MAG: hypothetical protein UT41_C0007G0003 [Candidatus Wolfebacteria bacterium GW2011_GWC2_39_22]|uniref:Uncharacterized protein n=1 Tax=Candidatus Wolfebacteria bacterium GW2011_GWC2_39_22 TaxID=1619013 RepID=A0A0G0QMW4_9BACT|nr:MAG: hypothetical protein UT41_C0007G0003 [Candidatus Wolfebacteria bacterium GW2011_GWC2_39_22]
MSKTLKVFQLVIDANETEQKINCLGKEVFLHFANLAYNARYEAAFLEKAELKTEKKAIEALNNVGIEVNTFVEKDTDVDLWVKLHDDILDTLKPDEEVMWVFRAYEDLANGNYEQFYAFLNQQEEPEEDDSLQDEELPTAEETVFCPKCDLVNPKDEKLCFECGASLYTVEERLENAGIIPTNDPIKQKQIDSKRHERLLDEKEGLEKDIEDYSIIVDGFNPNAIDSAWSILQTKSNNYLAKARETEETKEKENYLKAAKNIFKNIESLQNLSVFVEGLKNNLGSLKSQLRSNKSSLENFQLDIGLEFPNQVITETVAYNQVEELSKEAAASQEVPETVNPVLEEIVDEEIQEMIQEESEEIVNPEINGETAPEEMTFEKEVAEVA